MSLSKNTKEEKPSPGINLIPPFHTPFKNKIQTLSTQSSNRKLLFSGDFYRNYNSGGCQNNICNKSDCKCKSIDRKMKNFVFSPSTNFLFHSPDSFEKYMESLTTERINVLKLVKNNPDHTNKENSFIKSHSNSLISSGKSLKSVSSINELAVSGVKTKKNLLDDFENNNLNMKLFDNSFEINELNKKKNRSQSFKDILNSPVSKTAIFYTEKKKRKVEDEYRDNTYSIMSSDYKSSYAPTVFSTQKKDAKRHRKNCNQIRILQDEYTAGNCRDWTKEKITEISTKTGLSENKVYKWLWDQKNKIYEKKRFIISNVNN